MPSFCDKINCSFCFSPNFSTQILKMLVIFEMISVQLTFGSVSKMPDGSGLLETLSTGLDCQDNQMYD